MNLEDLQKRAIEIRDKYDELNKSKRGVVWSEQQIMAGFVGDVGDLSKIIMAKHGLRDMSNVDAKLAHELSDCLWSVLFCQVNMVLIWGMNFKRLWMSSIPELILN